MNAESCLRVPSFSRHEKPEARRTNPEPLTLNCQVLGGCGSWGGRYRKAEGVLGSTREDKRTRGLYVSPLNHL